jgi:hypothetical protein
VAPADKVRIMGLARDTLTKSFYTSGSERVQEKFPLSNSKSANVY